MEQSEYFRMYHLETDFWWYRVLHELVDSTVVEFKEGGTLSILDAGCGTGRMMEICRKHGTVFGIDFSADAVELSKKRGLANVGIGDLNDYPFEKESFDVVICLDVLYHSGIRDDLTIAGKFFDALKNNGILILNLPAFECLRRSHDMVVHTKKRYRKKEFAGQLKKIGFSVVNATYRMPHLFFIILLSKLTGKKNNPEDSESDLKKLPDWLNNFLLFWGRIENQWIKRGLSIPVGSSLFIVAKKTQLQ